MKYFLIVISLLLLSCSKPEQSKSTPSEQPKLESNELNFVVNFYKSYLSASNGDKAKIEKEKIAFFSHETVALFENEEGLCDKFNRIGYICKLTDDYDPFTQAQSEIKFSDLQFTQIAPLEILVKLKSFDISGIETRNFVPHMKIILKNTDQGLRAYDAIPYDDQKPSPNNSIRNTLTLSINSIRKTYRPLQDGIDCTYLMVTRRDPKFFKKLLTPTVAICKSNICSDISYDSEKITDSISEIYEKYKDDSNPRGIKSFFEKFDISNYENPTEHQQVEINGFTFEFIDQLWYITKIDLDKLTE